MIAKQMHAQLDRLIAGLLPYQEKDFDHPDGGALHCPFHRCFHTRCGEAAFPMVFAGISNNDALLVQKGLLLCDWLVRQQNADGSWHETPDTWKGTTVFQLLALAAVVQQAPACLTPGRAYAYRQALVRACGWVCRNVSLRSMTTNYVAGAAAALAVADRAVPDNAAWRRAADRLARKVLARINADGLFEGEGWGLKRWKIWPLPSRAIDIGYNLEMTLTALSIYAAVAGDEPLAAEVVSATGAHLPFIYPDGSLDDSLGSRGYKWTLFGSKTAHGSHAALAYAGTTIPAARSALRQTVDYLDRFIKDGLVGDGPCLTPDQGFSCVYATVTRSCSLALALAMFDSAAFDAPVAPIAPANRVEHYKSLNSLIVTHAPWKSTISGYGEKLSCDALAVPADYYVPGGGAVTYLYHQKWGAVQAATQLEYHIVEPLHVPHAAGPVKSLTPRAAIHTAEGTATSAHWRTPVLSSRRREADLGVRAEGGFLRPSGAVQTLPDHFGVSYIWSGEKFTKSYTLDLKGRYPVVEIIEPVLLPDATTITAAPDGLRLRKPDGVWLDVRVVRLSGPWQVSVPADPWRVPLPALAAVGLVCRLDNPEPGNYRVEIQFEVGRSAGEDACRA
jgi:hypothetical protein